MPSRQRPPAPCPIFDVIVAVKVDSDEGGACACSDTLCFPPPPPSPRKMVNVLRDSHYLSETWVHGDCKRNGERLYVARAHEIGPLPLRARPNKGAFDERRSSPSLLPLFPFATIRSYCALALTSARPVVRSFAVSRCA